MVSARPPSGDEIDGGTGAGDRILRAATVLFAERGFAATSVRDIASSAGAQPSALYAQFVSKEGLLSAIGVAGFERAIRRARRALVERASKSAGDQLDALVRTYVGGAVGWPPQVLSLDDELLRLPRDVGRPALSLRTEFWSLFVSVVDRGREREEFHATDDPELLVGVVRSMCRYLAQHLPEHGFEPVADACSALTLRLVEAGHAE